MSFSNALKWSFFSELLAKSIQPIVFLVLARMLTPEDFGVMTAAMMVIIFSQVFWEAGLGKALIQRHTDIKAASNAAFIINVSLSILIASLLYVFAKPIAHFFFQDSRVASVIQIMTLHIVLGALCSVQNSLLQKEMNFKKLFWVRFATIGLPGLASIPLALIGWGYWALVVGTLIGQFAQLVVLWIVSDWRPGLFFKNTVTKEMLKFGSWVVLTGLLSWFYTWADALLVGHYLGNHDLGLFKTGGQLPAIIFTLLFGPIIPVFYSYLIQIDFNKNQMRDAVEISIASLTIIAIPISLLLYIYALYIERFIFGSAWHGIGYVLGLMSLMQGFSWIVGFNGEFYRAIGKSSYETIIQASTFGIYLLVYLLVIQQGLEIFVWTRMLLAIVALILHLLLLKKVFDIDFFKVIRKLIFTTFFSFSIIFTIKELGVIFIGNAWVQLFLMGSLSVLALILFIYFTEKNQTFLYIKNVLRK